MKPYPKYKDSGIGWIEEIPEDWPMLRLKYFMKINPSKTSTVLNENISGEVSFLPMEKVDSDGKYDIASMKPIEEVNNGFTCFKQNDVIFAKITPCFENGKGALLDKIITNIGFGSTEFHVLRSIRNMSNPKYLYYITKTHPFRKMGEAFMSGSAGQKRVPSSFIENLFFPYSPLPEQKQIAKYLDHKTTKIDSLIEKKKRLIEFLKEERAAVINQAVTKGLDPNVPMKDSGIEWLGEVPGHWEVVPLTKYLASIVDYRGRTPKKVSDGIFLVTAKNIKNGIIDYTLSEEFVDPVDVQSLLNRGRPKVGDVLFTTEAPLGEVANIDREDIALAQRVIKFRGKQNRLNNFFLKFWMLSSIFQQDLQSFATGSTALGIKASKLNYLRLVLPPIDDQLSIVKHIEKETSRIDSIISTSEKEIGLLQEYRTALISEVVTGKIDVREEMI